MIMFRIGHTLALSCLMIAGTAATLNAQERVAITSATNRLIISQVGNGITTTPWITVLVTPYDTSSGGDKALIVQTSSITGIFSADIRLSQFTLLLENAGIQARVLIDCAPPTCVSTSNTVPANT